MSFNAGSPLFYSNNEETNTSQIKAEGGQGQQLEAESPVFINQTAFNADVGFILRLATQNDEIIL
jgi:hypothetical protein